ncbi:hypothetical protein [Streptomyces profundus]|uniref:hypothetical protein n=1 Tax=Streptomyces profundus TaxID=2867410 RepID=UPI001D1686FB|nr:hypothetical protein [Streptomyces sp. MA3_2.13]UED82959.1 hypothetical protein K4G22_01110 [Streptomyces sp. MA3_2.13]
MADLVQLNGPDAAEALRAAGEASRGFLGLDPVVQNDALLTRELARLDGRVFRVGDALVGAAPNPAQPRQALVACTHDDEAAVRSLVEFLVTYRRNTSFLALVPEGSPAVAGFLRAGLTDRGVLRDHRYASGSYHDVRVLFGTGDQRTGDACRS